jgi:hypothetical protein
VRHQLVNDFNAIEQRHNQRALLGQKSRSRRNLSQRIILYRHQRAIHAAKIFYVVTCLDRSSERSFRRSDFKTVFPQRSQVRRSRQHADLMPIAGQQAAVISADTAGAQNRNLH